MEVNKTDSLLGFLDMPAKSLFHIIVTVKVIVALCGVASEQESVFFRIHTEAVLGAVVPCKVGIEICLCKCRHITAVMQKPLVLTECIDYLIKLRLEFVCFSLVLMVVPCGIKAVTGAVKIATHMLDSSCLSRNLLGLCPSLYLHQRSSPLLIFSLSPVP